MSKYIRITEEMRRQTHEELDRLMQGSITDGKLSFTKLFIAGDRKAVIHFSERAWLRMGHLIAKCTKEVAWHGVARRSEDEESDEYFIDDILIYPQEVTGSTVNTDQELYQTWLMSQPDEVFNNIRMQGHSHVNMAVSPSPVDLEHQRKILDQLEGDMFYIFMIWNKRLEKNIWIYDYKKNILFETADCKVDVLPGPLDLEAFLNEADTMVKERTFTQTPPVYGKGTTPTTPAASKPGSAAGANGTHSVPSQPALPQAPSTPATPQSAAPKSLQKKRTTVDDYKDPSPSGYSGMGGGWDDDDRSYPFHCT